jgi:hypothetical protein
VHSSLGFQRAEWKPQVCQVWRLDEPFEQGRVEGILSAPGICALKLVVLYLRAQLKMVTDQDGMFDRRQQCRQDVRLQYLSSFLAQHDLAS